MALDFLACHITVLFNNLSSSQGPSAFQLLDNDIGMIGTPVHALFFSLRALTLTRYQFLVCHKEIQKDQASRLKSIFKGGSVIRNELRQLENTLMYSHVARLLVSNRGKIEDHDPLT
jgi:hypothetical protein